MHLGSFWAGTFNSHLRFFFVTLMLLKRGEMFWKSEVLLTKNVNKLNHFSQEFDGCFLSIQLVKCRGCCNQFNLFLVSTAKYFYIHIKDQIIHNWFEKFGKLFDILLLSQTLYFLVTLVHWFTLSLRVRYLVYLM